MSPRRPWWRGSAAQAGPEADGAQRDLQLLVAASTATSALPGGVVLLVVARAVAAIAARSPGPGGETLGTVALLLLGVAALLLLLGVATSYRAWRLWRDRQRDRAARPFTGRSSSAPDGGIPQPPPSSPVLPGPGARPRAAPPDEH